MNAVSLMHVLAIAPGLLWLSTRTEPLPAWVRLALALVAAYALVKHLPRLLKKKKKKKDL